MYRARNNISSYIMKKTLFVLFIALAVSACGPSNEVDTSAGENAEEELVNGVQTRQIEAAAAGFKPSRIDLKAGVPARLIFTRTSEDSCAETISVPEFGIDKRPLPVGEEVFVEFTPQKAGEFTFVCGMDMQEGALVVSG